MQRCFTSLQKHSREEQEEGGGGNASHRVAYDIKQDGLLLVLENNKEDNVTVSHQHNYHQTNEFDQPPPSHTHNKFKKWRQHTAYLLVEITHKHTHARMHTQTHKHTHPNTTNSYQCYDAMNLWNSLRVHTHLSHAHPITPNNTANTTPCKKLACLTQYLAMRSAWGNKYFEFKKLMGHRGAPELELLAVVIVLFATILHETLTNSNFDTNTVCQLSHS